MNPYLAGVCSGINLSITIYYTLYFISQYRKYKYAKALFGPQQLKPFKRTFLFMGLLIIVNVAVFIFTLTYHLCSGTVEKLDIQYTCLKILSFLHV